VRLELIGLNHRVAPVEVRERASMSPEAVDGALRGLVGAHDIEGVAILSTCNRTEVYLSPLQHLDEDDLRALFARLTGVTDDDVAPAYIHRDEDAMAHLVRVSSGLDSQMLGEVQILGQLKDAYQRALDAGATNGILNKALLRAIEAGKDVRNRTGISEGGVSVASAAVQMAQRIFGSLESCKVLLVGAGETARLAANHLRAAGVEAWRIANRTEANAHVVADLLGGEVTAFPPEAGDLDWADVVVAATGAQEPVLAGEAIETAVRKRKRPLLLLDLGIPRDIDPALADHGDAYLYGVDDFQDLVAANLATREREARRAEQIVDKHVEDFAGWYRENRVAPTIAQLHEVLEDLRAREVERNRKRFSAEDHEQLDRFSKALMRKVEGLMAGNLRQASRQSDDLDMADAVARATARDAGDERVKQVLARLRQERSHG
jgi:glutamyl-tRNA reductase